MTGHPPTSSLDDLAVEIFTRGSKVCYHVILPSSILSHQVPFQTRERQYSAYDFACLCERGSYRGNSWGHGESIQTPEVSASMTWRTDHVTQCPQCPLRVSVQQPFHCEAIVLPLWTFISLNWMHNFMEVKKLWRFLTCLKSLKWTLYISNYI